nr:MAG TPA: hypothetical protein [Caudoviricetes sp.]
MHKLKKTAQVLHLCCTMFFACIFSKVRTVSSCQNKKIKRKVA